MASSLAKFTFSCPHCDKVLRTASRPAAGKRIKCPACGDAFVPELDDDENRIQERPTLKSRSSPASRNRRVDEDDDDVDLGRRKPEKKPGVNLIVIGLAAVGALGLCLVCSGVGLTAFVWPGFALTKKAAEPKLAAAEAPKGNADAPNAKAPDKQGGAKKLNYYPIDVGNTWHYRVNANGKQINMGMRISRQEIIDGQPLARLDTLDGTGSEHLTQTENGVYRHRTNGLNANPRVQILPYPPTVGAKWQNEFTTDLAPGKHRLFGEIQQEEFVDVPAGRFKALRVSLRVESIGPVVQSTYWFVNDVGYVKQSINIPGANVLMELERYELKNFKPGP